MEDFIPNLVHNGYVPIHYHTPGIQIKYKAAAAVLLFVLSFFYSLLYRGFTLSYYDEAIRVARGYMLELFLKGDLKNPLWQSVDGYDQPMLSQFVYGAMLYPDYVNAKAGNGPRDYLTYMIDLNLYDATYQSEYSVIAPYVAYQTHKKDFIDWSNATNGGNTALLLHYGPQFQKTIHAVLTARSINVVFMSITSVILFFLAMRFFPVAAALLITLWYGTNSLIVSSGLLAMNEGLFLLLFVSGVYLLVDYFSGLLSLKKAVLIGLVSGLCMATKLNGVMIYVFFAFIAFVNACILFAHRKYRQAVTQALTVVVVGAITCMTFIAINPFTYPNPLRNIMTMYTYRLDSAKKDTEWDTQHSLPTLSDRAYVFVEDFFGNQANDYSLPFQTNAVVPGWFASVLASITFVAGVIAFLKTRVLTVSEIRAKYVFIFLSIMTVLTMLLYLNLYRNRYVVPLSVFVLWFEGAGIYSIGALIISIFYKRRK